jgi:hypothetical protein
MAVTVQATSPDRRTGRLPLVLVVVIAVVLVVGVAAAITSKPARRRVAAGSTSTTATAPLLVALDALPQEPEQPRTGYDRSLFPHWDDVDHDGCDTRCEVLASQRRVDGTWLSAWDGYVTDDPSELEIDHVVALAEAWDSGANGWTAAQRDDFADDQSNLLAVSESENSRKGDRDAAEWFPARADANCLFASTVVRVKTKWTLSVDRAEHDALANLLRTC